MQKILVALVCFVSLFMLSPVTSAETKQWSASMQVQQDKQWDITFSQPVGETDGHVFLMNENNEQLNYTIRFNDDRTTMTIIPEKRYEQGKQYKLVIEPTLKSERGKRITNGIEKTFMIADEEKNSFKFAEDILTPTGWKFVSESDDLGFKVYRFEVPEGQIYEVNQPVYLEPFGEYDRGLIGQVLGYDIRQDEENDPVIIRIVEPDLENVMDEFVFTEAMPINIQPVTMADNKGYTVAATHSSYAKSDLEYEVMFYDYSFKHEGKVYTVKGDLKLEDLTAHPNVTVKNVMKGKNFGFTLSGNIVHNLTFEAGNVKDFEKNSMIDQEEIVPAKTKDFIEGEVRVPSFPAVGVEVGLEFFLEMALTGGVRLVNVDDFDFELGFFYDNKGKLQYVNDFKRQKHTPTLAGFGEAKIYAGIKGYTNVFLTELDLIQFFSKFGPYAQAGVYTTLDSFFASDNVCYGAEMGMKLEYGIKLLPQFGTDLELKTSNALKLQEQSKSCQFIKSIKTSKEAYEVEAGTTFKPTVEAYILDVQNGEKKYKKLTTKQKKKVTYKVDTANGVVTASKDGFNISKNATAQSVTVQVIYTDESDRQHMASTTLNIKPNLSKEAIIKNAQNAFIEDLKKDEQYLKVAFKDVKNPHIVTMTPVYETWGSERYEIEKSLKVFEYSEKTKKWTKVYETVMYPPHFLEKKLLNLYGDQREQLFLTMIEGSGSFLSTSLIGENKNGKVAELIAINSIMNGELQISKESFKVCKNVYDYGTGKTTSSSKSYKWNGSKIAATSGGACK